MNNSQLSLIIDKVSFGYTSKNVIEELSASFQGGQLISVLGANGAGKSTLFRLILGLLPTRSGAICVNECDVATAKPNWLAKQMAYIPQTHNVALDFSVMEMVLLGKTAKVALFATPHADDYADAKNALEQVGIASMADHNFNELSGGEQQLVLIARAICQDAPIMIMDEPCSSLDYGNQIRILRTIKDLAGKGYLILLSTHTPEHAQLFADTVLILDRGKILALDTPEKAMTAENLSRIYRIPIAITPTLNGDCPVIRPAMP